jgi:ABC-type branched-subunit amino acid transport system substrate-binding protein
LYGRQQAVGLVREFMKRPEHDGKPTSRRVPVILFTGPRGSGKTALLTELKNRLDENVPYSCIDCGSFDAGLPWNVLTRLVFDFNLSAAKYRKVPFPRFVAARVVIEEELDLNDEPTAERQVEDVLARYREAGRLRAFLTGLAEELAAAGPGLGGVPGAEGAGRKIAEGVSKALLSWQVLNDEGVTWFGTGAAGIRRLVELNRLTRSANEEDKQEATKRLWAAFLADLRAAFGTGRGARAWSLNCVVLLDDADSRRGVLLLRELTQARRQHAVDHPGEPDPLTVVATASVRTHIAPDGRIVAAEEAGYADYESRTGVESEWYYPVGLRDLTFDEVHVMVAAAGGGVSNKQLAASVYRFTLGHPAATAVLVDAIVRNGGRTAPLKTLLQVRLPGGQQDVTAEQKILRLLVGETSGEPFENLVTCSAARNIEQAEHLSRSDSDLVVPLELRASGPEATMLPVLRHLLLRRLADDAEKWSWVHQWLRDNGEEGDQWYHALAGRDVASVTTWLVDRLGDTKVDDWLAALHSITAAPNDLDCDDADPDQVLAMVGWTEPQDGLTAAVARLVAALWIAHDPMSHADRHKLFKAVEEDLRVLRQTVRQGRARLSEETERFTAMAGDPHKVVLSIDAPSTATKPGARPNVVPATFVPPVTTAERKRGRLRTVTIAAGMAVAVVAAVVVLWNQWSSCGDGVTEQGGECVGVTDGSYVFDDRLAEVEGKILAENERVDSEGHVTLALLTPMIPSETGSSTWERIRAQLEGAHAAQLTANEEDKWPKVKLVLAHPGSNQQEWRRVVGQLVEMIDAPERLVGVIGLVPSSPETQEVMRELAAANLPMVATLVTATNINESRVEGFTRVSSTTHDQVTVLSDHLGTATPRKAMLVYDGDEENLFPAALRDDFETVAPARANLAITVESRYDTEAPLSSQLKSIMGDLCGDGAPDTILYAARAELFDELVVNVRERNCARDRVITVVSGSDASVLRARDDLKPNSRDDNAPTVIVYTPLVDPDALRQDGVAEFDQLAAQFAELGFGAADLADGWAVITHDGVLAATEAVGRAAAGRGGELPSNTDVRFELGRTDRERNQVRGASGTFTLDAETGNVVGRRLPVVEVDQNWTFTVKGIYDAGLH